MSVDPDIRGWIAGARARLEAALAREGRTELAEACFRFLPTRGELDLCGWDEPDIFQH